MIPTAVRRYRHKWILIMSGIVSGWIMFIGFRIPPMDYYFQQGHIPCESDPKKQLKTETAKTVETVDFLLKNKIASATSGNLFRGKPFRLFPINKVLFATNQPSSMKNETSSNSSSNSSTSYECQFWSVVTTIFEPSDAVRVQANLGPDWCIVVVGDKKSPQSYPVNGTSRVVYLNVDGQLEFAKQFPWLVQSIPWNHFGRKNVGYLFAIKEGAQAIWDFDDDNMLKPGQKIIIPNDTESIEFHVPANHSFPTYNPYVKLGAPHLPAWPRGFPLEHIKRNESYASPLKRIRVRGDRIGVLQSLADHDPDVDALYRLIMPLPFNFAPAGAGHAKPILLPERTLAPMNAQACLFKRSTFFMALLPITVHGRVSDIWRSYIGERLLWELREQLHVAFTPPLVDQFRNPHSYLGDLDSEIPLYKQAGVLVDYLLNEWKGEAPTLPGRIEELYISLYERGYFEIQDVYLAQRWIQSLLDIGYEFPAVALSASPEDAWPDLELFIPLPPIDSAFTEYSTCLHPSMEFFWPKEHLNLLFITDGESPNATAFSQKLQLVGNPISNRTRVEFNHAPFAMLGHNRQQWIMFWADNFTSAEYIGFMDTDTVITSRVTRNDLFDERGKPRVLALYGEPYDPVYWEGVPNSTYHATGYMEKLKAMSYFPVIVKRSHLKIIRDHIRKHMNMPTFDTAFQAIVTSARRVFEGRSTYSQFNIMTNILYNQLHDEYRWHIVDKRIGWTGPVPPGQVESLKAAAFPPEDRSAYPHIAVHWTYEPFGRAFGRVAEPEARRNFDKVMRFGYCSSLTWFESIPAQCDGMKLDTGVNPHEWMFESQNFADREESFEAHLQRRKIMLKLPKHQWNANLVAKYVY